MYNNIQKASKATEKNTKKRLLKEQIRRMKKENIGDHFTASIDPSYKKS